MALTHKGELFTFGNSKDGKLGYEEIKKNVYIPKKVVMD
jgi:alpha-tubulin suppressor-like RCC1 family protein